MSVATKQKRRVNVGPNLYQRPKDGKFEGGLSINGKWTMKTFEARTKKEAELELAAWKVEVATQSRKGLRADASVHEVATAWLLSFEQKVTQGERSPRSLDHYRSNYKRYVKPYFGATEIGTVGPDELVGFLDFLRSQEKSPWVLRGVTDVLSRIFKRASGPA
jgi:hypothetical protein